MTDHEKRCPTCNRLLDALRAPIVRIHGGRIVAFCSSECAAGRQSAAPLPPPPEPEVAPQPMTLPLRERTSDEPGEITPPPDAEPRPAPRRRAESVVESPPPPRRWGIPLVVTGIVVAGIAVALPLLGRQVETPVVPAAVVETTPPPAPPPAPPQPPTKAEILESARQRLHTDLAAESPRVRRVAALALSRIGDPDALAELRRGLAEDDSEIRRLEIAHGLARAGDKEALEVLVTALKSSRRDVRLEAARALVRLGDPRGLGRLREALGANQLRLGAAENLAILGDEEAKKILRTAMTSGNPEHRMRAAVALGRAGDDSAAPVLREIVGAEQVEMGAADALARLGDKEVVPALTRALANSALRVDAATSLRLLQAEVDLAPLVAAMAGEDEHGRISAAEAVLVLLGPQGSP